MKKVPFVTKEQIEEIVKTYPTPFHLYDEKGLRENAKRLYEAFSWNPGYKEYFAVKADSIIAFHTGDSLFTIIKADTVLPVIPKAVKRTGYDNRVHRFRKNWERIIPTHAKIQYAGNMGLLSFGTGWDYGKRNQWETDILLGFIPKYSSKKTKVTMTLKQNYMPWSINIGKGFSTEPLACGLYLNTVFGDQFWVNEPDRYPKGYYGFSSKVRIHIYMGQRLTYDIDPQRRFLAKSVTFFYETSNPQPPS